MTWRYAETEVDLSDLRYHSIPGDREAMSWLVEQVSSAMRYLIAMVMPAPRNKAWRLMHRRAVLSPPPKYRKKLRMPRR